ncbi:MAG: Gfo/Idh/MocA family oxidoreductase [Candidatus Hydrogenedentes bacterium]|nr:Gfo/Idh/MocA family oxidoreductase [Candidatus Hydrogenedentota bacterium]
MNRLSRRDFVSRGAAGIAITALHQPAKAGESTDKLNIAVVGVGGMGASNLRNVARENIVALCDVDDEYAAKVYAAFPQAAKYKDYREMLAKSDIDGVVIATPDHTHAVIAAACMRAKKHVYCQKPLTHNVYEARRLAEIARETGVVTQMGIQGHSGEGIRQIKEWIQAGAIGEVSEVDAWCSLTYYPWGHAAWSSPVGVRPTETPPVPGTLNWDLWLGPAPERPYHRCYHPRTWRSFLDFGSGMMGDRGAHTFDPIFYALDLGHPASIDGNYTDWNGEVHPVACLVQYEFPARGTMPPVTLTWYDGLRPPRPAGLLPEDRLGDPEGGALFKGSEGMITCNVYGNEPRLLPASRMKEFKPPEPTIPRVECSHEQDWLNAIRTNTRAGADFAYSGPLTEVCQLGNIAKRMNARIEWDPAKMEFPNMPDANQYVTRQYRNGWTL